MKEITLTQGKVTAVDDDDYIWLSRFKWHAHFSPPNWYAHTTIMGSQSTPMHRMILPGMVSVDHADRDSLNNRKSNLRGATKAQNCQNKPKRLGCSSKYKGVFWYTPLSKWAARISKRTLDRKHVFHLGYFVSEYNAAAAYDRAARDMFGCFAATNRCAE